MPRTDLQQIFLESVGEVLETMFFTGIVEEDSKEESDSLVSAELVFHGHPSGRFGVRVPYSTSRRIASSFLGLDEDELSEEQIGEVVCELTNMVCGSVLSRVETEARFELMHPEIDPRNCDWRKYKDAVGSTFGLEEGSITVWMTLEENQPALVA
jgi:CheY-specific phosphatase CheX